MTSKSLKVAILTITADETNGWGRYTSNLVRSLSKQGVSCLIFAKKGAHNWNGPGEYFPILESCNSNGIKKLFDIVYDWWRLRKLVADCDVVHVFTEPHVLLAWLLGKPYVVSTHGTFALRYLERPLLRFWAQRAFLDADMVVLTSKFTEKQLSQHVKLTKTVLIPNGVNTDKFKILAGSTRAAHQLITVGAVKPRKGQDMVIQSVARLKASYPDIRYVIVGDLQFGSSKDQITKLIRENRLEKNVEIRSGVSDEQLVHLYNQSSLYVQASRFDETGSFEGYPLTFLEAHACGLPLIGTDACAAAELITDGHNGYLVHQNNLDELTEKIDLLLGNQPALQAMGKNALAVAQKLSWDRNAEELVKMYSKIAYTK